jgi:Ser/Thr protein kinase RdoA (MazF antagonist)
MDTETVETQTAAVLRTFGLGDLRSDPREIARGEMGRVFRVETSNGVWALKEYITPTWAPRDLQLEDRFMHAAREAGVAVPRACRTSEGGTLAAVGGTRWKAFEWIEVVGKPSAWQVGETVARLHGIGSPSNEAVHPWYTQRGSGGTWQQLADLSRGQDWEALLLRHLAELIAQDQIVAAAKMPPCRMCHRDINEGNAVLDAKGRVVLFDWDDCGPLAPEREVAYVLVNPFICPDPAEFLAAYRDAGGIFEPSGLEVFATAIAVNNNYLAALVHRSMTGDRRAHTELLSMLESPLRISDMQALLNVACV